MNDGCGYNKLDIYFSWIGSIFGLPIGEIIDKRHHGILYFSKIKLEWIRFFYSSGEVLFLLDPIEITYYDYVLNKKKRIWYANKKITNKEIKEINKLEDMKEKIFKWFERENIELFSIVDYGPFSAIKNKKPHILNEEEIKIYLQSDDENKKRLRQLDEKRELKIKKKILLNMRHKALIKEKIETVKKFRFNLN